MKKLLIICVVIVCCLSALMLISVKQIAQLGEDGYAVPEKADILNALRAGDANTEALTEVNCNDTVYATLTSYFVGNDRIAIDKSFPVFIRGGAVARFLDEENWLISTDLDLLQTYEGLYLSNGYTYNSDLTQADVEEFILLQMKNGLYLNAQHAVLTTRLDTREIPANSILLFNESYLRWYYQSGASLRYSEEEAVFDAEITIGGHTYPYNQLLRVLGLLREAADKMENNEDPSKELDEAFDILGEEAVDDTELEPEKAPALVLPDTGEQLPSDGTQGAVDQDGKLPQDSPTQKPEKGDTELEEKPTDRPSATEPKEDVQKPAQKPGEDVGGDAEQTAPTEPNEPEEDEDAQKPGQDQEEPPKGGDTETEDDREPGGSGTTKPGESDTDGEQDVQKPSGPSDDKPGEDTPDTPSSPEDGNKPGIGESGGNGGIGDNQSPSAPGQSGDGNSDAEEPGFGEEEDDQPGTGDNDNIPGAGTDSEGGESSDPEESPEGTGGDGDGSFAPGQGEGSGDISGGEDKPSDDDDKEPGAGGDSGDNESGEDDSNPPEDSEEEENQPDSGPVDPNQKPGESGEYVYIAPQISLSAFEPWSYAVKAKLNYYDPAGTLIKGVRINVYDELSGNGMTGTEEGVKTYSQQDYKGKRTLLRKTYTSDQELALSVLPPDNTVYIQFSYRYKAEETVTVEDVQTGLTKEETRIVRKTAYSPFYEVTTTKNENLPAVLGNWTEAFAAYDQQIRLDNLVLSNSSDYNADAEKFDFDNFKKNILPYINRLEITLKPKGLGESITLTTNTNIVRSAQMSGGATYISAKELEENTKYTYTVVAKDRYNNDIPLILGDGYTGVLFTGKNTPSIQIEEVENVTDKLTLKVTVKDTSRALLTENGQKQPLILRGYDGITGSSAILAGKWKDGTAFGSLDQNKNTTELVLEEPADGKSYTFTLESLSFAKSYRFEVSGSYDPQPEGAEDMSMRREIVRDTVLGSGRFFTAAITNGTIKFGTSIESLTDTAVSLGFTMTQDSSVAVLPLVDAFEISIVNTENNEAPIKPIYLKLEDLDEDRSDEYNENTHSIVIQSDDTQKTPTVELVGDKDQFIGRTLWQALMLSTTVDEDGDPVYSSPVKIRVSLYEDTLDTFTKYTYSVRSLVYKMGEPVEIPTVLTSNEFTTKKIRPEVLFNDLFIAADIVEFLNLEIYDPDETIMNGGQVRAYLYHEGTLLKVEDLQAQKEKGKVTTNLRFENIISDSVYTIKLEALAYNDEGGFAGYTENELLWSASFKGGSGLYGKLHLRALEYESVIAQARPWFTYNGGEIQEKIDSKQWSVSSGNLVTAKLQLPTDATYLRVEDYIVSGVNSVFIFYDAADKYITFDSVYKNETYPGHEVLVKIPPKAVTVKMTLPGADKLLQEGMEVTYYTSQNGDLLDSVDIAKERKPGTQLKDGVETTNKNRDLIDKKFLVHPGDLLYPSAYVGEIYLWSSSGQFRGALQSMKNAVFVVPEGVSHISVAVTAGRFDDASVHVVAEAERSAGFCAEMDVEVRDNEGYLRDDPQVTVHLYRSETINEAVYEEKPYYSEVINLERDTENEGTADIWQAFNQTLLEKLPENFGWRMVIEAEYQESQVVLDEIRFQTDGIYNTISNAAEFMQLQYNPYGRYLVVDDFTITSQNNVTETFRGVLDGQGHVITIAPNKSYLINTIAQESVVRNLAIEFAEDYTGGTSIFNNNYGLIENIVFRTKGELNITRAAFIMAQNHGILRNFIIRLGGDLFANNNSFSLITYQNTGGLIEDGYVYGDGNAGILTVPNENAHRYTGLIFSTTQSSIVRNLYTDYDTWHPSVIFGQNHDRSTVLSANNAFSVTGYYHFGENYLLNDDGTKGYATRTAASRVGPTTASGNMMFENVWHLTDSKYDPAENISLGTTAKLHDIAWQREVLGDGFDLENSVAMGFFPRIYLPKQMQKHQEYRFLPDIKADVPKLVSDSIAEDYEQDNGQGVIRLRFVNTRNVEIKSVDIEGLECQVQKCFVGTDGLYNVDVLVKAEVFKSAYTVTGFNYNIGSGTAYEACNYITQNVEFWREVATPDDWMQINNSMSENYRLVADIDLSPRNITAPAVQIDGNPVAVDKTGIFYGKLDGDMHTISNIDITSTTGSVIYVLGADAEVKNLIIDNMNLTKKEGSTTTRSGFIGDAREGSIIDNVHIRNSEVHLSGIAGFLVGNTSQAYATIRNCSVADSAMYDIKNNLSTRMGGLIGIAKAYITNCYTRNVKIEIANSSNATGIGGLAGELTSGLIENCYAKGSIIAVGNNVGGLAGTVSGYSTVKRCWADVDVNITGDYVGGLLASEGNQSCTNNFVAGDLMATGDNFHRVLGAERIASIRYNYAYEGQSLTEKENHNSNDTTELLTGKQLTAKGTWTDLIQFGSSWDMEPLTRASYPKVYRSDGAGLVYGQEDIGLPGQGNEHTLTLNEAVRSANDEFYISAIWNHPGVDIDTIRSNLANGIYVLGLDGMNMADPNRYTLKLFYLDDENTELQLTNYGFEKAFDQYLLTITSTKDVSYNVKCQAKYSNEAVYHEVPNVDEWNKLMDAGHGTTMENFKITGFVDFNGSTDFINLKLGRLEGVGPQVSGFRHLKLNAQWTGSPWIETVVNDVKNLAFHDILGDFSSVTSAYTRPATGMILTAANVSNCHFTDIEMNTNFYSDNYVGFFSTVKGVVENVTINTMTLSGHTNTNVKSYAGALAAIVGTGAREITAENISVSVHNSYTGGLFGYLGNSPVEKITNESIHVEDITVEHAYNDAGCIAGIMSNLQFSSVKNSSVTSDYHAASVASQVYGDMNQIQVINNVVTSKTANTTTTNQYRAAGVVGISGHGYDLKNVLVKDCEIYGNNFVGGVACDSKNAFFENLHVVDCTITCTAETTNSLVNAVAGGILAADTDTTVSAGSYGTLKGCTVRNTHISSPERAGGLIGKSDSAEIWECYVAEDVTVTATMGAGAGGLIGGAIQVNIRDSATGAEVTGKESVGGIVGMLSCIDASRVVIDNVYVGGKITATMNYAGGVIGSLTNAVPLTTTKLNGAVVFADVSASGDRVSYWANSNTLNLTSSGDANVLVWNGAQLNGQPAKAIAETAQLLGEELLVIPASGRLVTTEELQKASTYQTELSYSTTYWDYSDLREFMPYPKFGGQIVRYSNYSAYDEKTQAPASAQVGIRVPIGAENADQVRVYASGVDRVNIELPNSITAVAVNGTTYTADANGVVTLLYDFQTDLTVGGVVYDAQDLRRTVMTRDGYWYYIEKGLVYYGVDKQDGSKPTITNISDAIHLYRGSVLCSDGSVYDLSQNTATERSVGYTAFTQVEATPFHEYTAQTNNLLANVAVYHDFTDVDGTRIEHRIFEANGSRYRISTSQNTVYDGVIMSSYDDGVNTVEVYFAYLLEDGTIDSQRSVLNPKDFIMADIDHISNNFNYDRPIVLARYHDGSVAGYNYGTGEMLFATKSVVRMFMSFARNQLSSVFGGFFDGLGANTDEEGSWQLGDGTETDGTSEKVDEEGTGKGEGLVEQIGIGGSTGSDADTIGGEQAANGTAPGGDSGNGEFQPGGSPAPGDAGDDTTGTNGGGGEAVTSGTASGSNTGEAATGEIGLPVGTAATDAAALGATIEVNGFAVPVDGVCFVPGSGVYANGVLAVNNENAVYVEGEGVYVDQELIYVESLEANASNNGQAPSGTGGSSIQSSSEGTGGAVTGSVVRLVTPAQRRQQVVELLDAKQTFVYDEATGTYVETESASLLNAEVKEEAPPQEQITAQPIGGEKESAFKVTQGGSIKLTDEKRGGVILLMAVAGVVTVILVIIYVKAFRKNKKK